MEPEYDEQLNESLPMTTGNQTLLDAIQFATSEFGEGKS